MKLKSQELLPGLLVFYDTCNVYLVRRGNRGIAIDFGSGAWLAALPALGIRHLDHVFLTHHHADQCAGLQKKKSWPFIVHAPRGEEAFLSPKGVRRFHRFLRRGCPPSYAVINRGLAGIKYDMLEFGDLFWGTERLRFIHTPGHGTNACSIILDQADKQVIFCGDAAYEGAKIWQPYHLEWDHWSGTGALAAWEGVARLSELGMDLLCPSHGPVIAKKPRAKLKLLAVRLMKFYRAKGSICPGEKDRYIAPRLLACGARKLLPHLYQFGCNGYLLLSHTGEAMIIDPLINDMPAMEKLRRELKEGKPAVSASTHFHDDHCDGIPYLRKRYGLKAYLHPRVAEALRHGDQATWPWFPTQTIRPDSLWPEKGTWAWREYVFKMAPWPGQTWWHCVFMTMIDGYKVVFGGDNFQPPSRWNGTGGFCAFNGSRFKEGFIPSAKLMLAWQPDIIAAGHGTYCRFFAPRFKKIVRWAERAEKTVSDLCPSGDLDRDYYSLKKVKYDS